MKSLDEALRLVLETGKTSGTEKVKLTEACGRVMAEDVCSDIDMPPFDKSAMDGYACRQADINNLLTVIEFIQAGKTPEKEIGAGQCSKIMTGSMVPKGADCVVMIENTEMVSDNRIKVNDNPANSNICFTGEDVHAGQKVISAGTLLKSQHLAILASAGCTEPLVYKVPSVGVIISGDELVEPFEKPGISKIRNSNAYQLLSQLKNLNLEPHYYGIAEDSKEKLKETMRLSISKHNLTIITGGASVGDFDFVPIILKELGMHRLFDKVAIKPGKPVSFAFNNEKFCFGLSGNPVSSFVQFELLVKPFIYKLMGHAFKPSQFTCQLAETKTRANTERLQFFPVKINGEGKAEIIEFHGSAHIGALADTAGLVAFPVGNDVIKKDTLVNVRQI